MLTKSRKMRAIISMVQHAIFISTPLSDSLGIA
jgi:hypothetical protein